MQQTQTHRSVPMPILAVLSVISVFLSLQAATQLFAWRYYFSPFLGKNLDHFYRPWDIFRWRALWPHDYGQMFVVSGLVGICVLIVCLIGVWYLNAFVRNTARANDTIHGSARWATRKDIE